MRDRGPMSAEQCRRLVKVSKQAVHLILFRQRRHGRVVVTEDGRTSLYGLAPSVILPNAPFAARERVTCREHANSCVAWFTDPRAGYEWRRPVSESDELRVAA